MAPSTDLLAVLFDADNVQHSQVGAVLAKVARLGTASVKRAYGDWTDQRLSTWKPVASQHVIQPMQQFAHTTGKNATDSALIIDAMDLLHTGRFQGFCIVSSDSDFTRLATRIREEGIPVYGFGKPTTPAAFRNACDQFTYLDAAKKPTTVQAKPPAAKTGPAAQQSKTAVAAKPQSPQRVDPALLRSDTQLVSALRTSIATASGEDGWADLGTVGSLARRDQPAFESRRWGYAKLSDLVRATELFVVEPRPSGGLRVRDKKLGG